jgi:hypothetical protein
MRSPLFWYGRQNQRICSRLWRGATKESSPLYRAFTALKNKAFSLFKILSLRKRISRQNVDKLFASFYVQRVCAVLGGVQKKEAIALGQIGDIGRPVLYLAVDTKPGYPFC